MSDWSGKPNQDDEVELILAVFLVFGLGPLAVVKFCGGSWGTFAAGWGVLLLLAGLAVLGWWGWGWVRGWRTDRVLRREDDEFAWASTTDNDHYGKGAGQ